MKTYKEFISEAESPAVEKLKKKYKTLATKDFQKRDGDYTSSGVPDTISVSGWKNEFTIRFDFKNTSERDATKWAERYLKQRQGKDSFKFSSGQDGDYKDDWVQVFAEIEVDENV
jgi:hypothetical protein